MNFDARLEMHFDRVFANSSMNPSVRDERIEAHYELLQHDNAAYAEALQECEGVMPTRLLVEAIRGETGKEYDAAMWRLAEADYERLNGGER